MASEVVGPAPTSSNVSMSADKERTKLHAEEDIAKLAVIKSNDTVAKKYLMCVAAASVAEATTYPLDLCKTRLQIQGETTCGLGSNTKYRGMLRTMLGIAREEGLLQLWRGMLPALYRHAIYTGFRMSAYEQIRNKLIKDKDGFSLWKKVVAGMSAGGFGQFMASPTDLVKTQIQMEGRRRLLGYEPRVDGTMDALRKIVAQGGVLGLWRGCWPNVQRAALVNLGDLSTYDSVKAALLENTHLEDNSTTHCMSSGCAGLVGAIMGTPADVVKARVMNQPTDSSGRGLVYKNSSDCLLQTVKGEGFMALYKGFLPCWLRMAPWSLTFWLSFEQIRRYSGATAW